MLARSESRASGGPADGGVTHTDDEATTQPEPSPPSVQAPPEPDVPITPADEAFQHLIDRDTLGKAITEARTLLSQLKISYWLARSGIDIKQHPKQMQSEIVMRRKWVDTLVLMWEELGTDGVVREPTSIEVSKLEVVGGHLNDGLNTP